MVRSRDYFGHRMSIRRSVFRLIDRIQTGLAGLSRVYSKFCIYFGGYQNLEQRSRTRRSEPSARPVQGPPSPAYGCGKAAILNHLQVKYPKCNWVGYDPAVDEYKHITQQTFDCVFSNDVLEHIEPECLHDVLDHIWQLGTKYIWLCIDTLPARKVLMDGRNAHLILEGKDWWQDILQKRDGKIVYIELGKKGKLYVAIER